MRHIILATSILIAAAAPAHAGELFAGVYAHAVKTPFTLDGGLEDGIDLQLGYRFAPVTAWKLEPYLFGAVNTKGQTSYAAVGISRRFGDRLYVRPGVGLAIHNGSTADFEQPDRIAFGNRILFEPEVSVGYRIDERTSIEASWVHLSHAQVFGGQNPGIDNIGIRANLRL